MGTEGTRGAGPAKVQRKDTSKTRSSEAEICAALVFLAALFLYTSTLAPTVTLVDSGELIVVARSLGIAHPPGFPLWIMLAHLASLVPFGSVALRINFSSAFFGALASAALTLTVAEVMLLASCAKISKAKKTALGLRDIAKGDQIMRDRLLVLGPALGSGLLLAFSRTLWSYATVTEVYALNTFLILVIFFLVLRWRRHIMEDRMRAGANSIAATCRDPLLYSAAFVFGLALGVHHVTVALMLPALAVIVYRTEGLRFFRSRRLIYAAIISSAALFAVYTYLPIAASRAPLINWGHPRSLETLWWHITGRQYQSFFAFAPNVMAEKFVEFVRMVLREFGWPWLPLGIVLAIVGFGNAFRRDRTIFWFLLVVLGVDLIYGLGYDIAEDKDAYFLPAFVSLAIAAGFGLRELIQFFLTRSMATIKAGLLTAILVLFVALVALTGNWSFNNRRHYFIAHDYVENILSSIEPNGLLLTLDWQVASPMLYAREIERRRRDVKIVDVQLLRRSWYFDYLGRAYPDLIERSRDQVNAFVTELKQWESDPQTYRNNPPLTQRIASRFKEMIQSFVIHESEVAPVYLTQDFLFARDPDREVSEWLARKYEFVPDGLVFLLETKGAFHDLPQVRLETRGLNDGTLKFEKNDVVNVKVLPAYTTMLINRGRYLASFNRHERAINAFKQALTLDRNLEVARQGMSESARKLRSP